MERQQVLRNDSIHASHNYLTGYSSKCIVESPDDFTLSKSESSRRRLSRSSSGAFGCLTVGSWSHPNMNHAQKRLLKKARRIKITMTQHLTDRKLLSILNFVTFLYLVLQTKNVAMDLMRANKWSSMMSCNTDYCDSLPYPMNLAVQSRQGRIRAHMASAAQVQQPGYTSVREGVFRTKYPSGTLSDVFDGVFVISNPKCHFQWREFVRHSSKAGLSIKRVEVQPYKRISLDSPPIPIASDAMGQAVRGNKAQLSILKREIAYLEAHREVWQSMITSNKQRALVLDDTVFPADRLLHLLPNLFNQVDQESVAIQRSWHVLTFRRKILHPNSSVEAGRKESVWCSNPRLNHPVVHAAPSYGSSLYAISLAGARWMLDHIRAYRASMDLEIAMLQRDHLDFVVLSACNNDEPRDFCPEIASTITVVRDQQHLECSWRRLHERQTAILSAKGFHMKRDQH